jgi:GT2 family glycosyltransferase
MRGRSCWGDACSIAPRREWVEMALSRLQSDILRLLAKNRSDSSYLAGGVILNKDWPRRPDDIGIFHDADEEVTEAARLDIATLDVAGFKVHRDFIIYGCVDATVSNDDEATVIQWFAETKQRFFPLMKDDDWGARLHQADLAVNKCSPYRVDRRPVISQTSWLSAASIARLARWFLRRRASRRTSPHSGSSMKCAGMRAPFRRKSSHR